MKLNYKKTIFVGFAFFLICAFWMAYDAIVPLMLVNKFGLNQTLSGFIMSIDNIIAVFLLPVFGTLSDKTRTKFGRRTPYIVIGTILSVLAFFALSFADNAQLKQLGNDVSSVEFHQQLFDENAEITNAEYSTISNRNVPKKVTVQDYASHIVFNKNYDQLSETEKHMAREWFANINMEYNEDHSKPETMYYYDHGTYYVVEAKVAEDGAVTFYYLDGLEKKEIKKIELTNAYSNIISPAVSDYAWGVTIGNPLYFIIFIILLLLTLIAMALFRSPAVALMPDVTIKPLRSQGNAVINLMGSVGGIMVLVLGMVFATGKTYNQMMSYTWYILGVCGVMLLGLALFLWKVREPKWAKEAEEDAVKYGITKEEEEAEKAAPGDAGKLSKGEMRSLILILASVALWYIGYNAVTSKYSLYATNVLHKDYNSTFLIAQAAAIVAYIPVGFLATKIGRKKSILAGVLILAVAFFGASFATANTPTVLLYILFALAGIGWATINVNSFPMAVELASRGNVGKYTGFYYTASMAAQIATPILSGFLMDVVGSMKPLFYYAFFFVMCSFVTMLLVKHGDSKPEKKKNALETLDVDAD